MDFEVPKQTKRLQTAYISDCYSLAQRTQRMLKLLRRASLYGAPLIAWQAKEIPRYGCRRNRHAMTLGGGTQKTLRHAAFSIFHSQFSIFKLDLHFSKKHVKVYSVVTL
jgi:hypothetical protein